MRKTVQHWLSRVLSSDYYTLTRFLFPLSFTVIAVDIGEQFLNRSLAHSENVVEVLAAFGLGFTIIKVFSGALGEVRHAGLMLVHDRTAYRKMLLFTILSGSLITVLLIITATTYLGEWLFRDVHGVSESVSDMTRSSLFYLCAYPIFDAISWYHGGLLLQMHFSALVGAAALADIIAQIFCVAILLYTPVLCGATVALPILAVYGGVITRCALLLCGFSRKVYPNISRDVTSRLSVWKIVSFLSPLMFTIFIQRISRPLINLIVARDSPSKTAAAEAVAVLTASYPLGHLPYGWLNTLKPVTPAFQQKKTGSNRPVIAGKKIAIFTVSSLAISAVASFVLGWIPGVSVSVLQNVVAIPRDLALLCVTPLRIFAFFCFTVSIRASLTGWLIVHSQTKLVAPSGLIRLAAIISSLFLLPQIGVNGADNGVASLFCGFFMEMMAVLIASSSFLCWEKYRDSRRERSNHLLGEPQAHEMTVTLTAQLERENDETVDNTELAFECRTSTDNQSVPRLASVTNSLTDDCKSGLSTSVL